MAQKTEMKTGAIGVETGENPGFHKKIPKVKCIEAPSWPSAQRETFGRTGVIRYTDDQEDEFYYNKLRFETASSTFFPFAPAHAPLNGIHPARQSGAFLARYRM